MGRAVARELRPRGRGIMTERFAEAKCTLARLRGSAGAEHLDGFGDVLFRAGFSRRSGMRYVIRRFISAARLQTHTQSCR